MKFLEIDKYTHTQIYNLQELNFYKINFDLFYIMPLPSLDSNVFIYFIAIPVHITWCDLCIYSAKYQWWLLLYNGEIWFWVLGSIVLTSAPLPVWRSLAGGIQMGADVNLSSHIVTAGWQREQARSLIEKHDREN